MEFKQKIESAGFECIELKQDVYPYQVTKVGRFWTWQGAYTYMVGQGLVK
jgi:hypothetical protein